MAKFLDLSPRPYVLLADLENPKEDQTVFHLQPLSAKMLAGALAISPGEQVQFSGPSGLLMLQQGLKGWDNFKDQNGAQITFPEGDMDKALNMIRGQDRMELARTLFEWSYVGRADGKN